MILEAKIDVTIVGSNLLKTCNITFDVPKINHVILLIKPLGHMGRFHGILVDMFLLLHTRGFYEIYFCLNVSTTNYMKRFSQFFDDMFYSQNFL